MSANKLLLQEVMDFQDNVLAPLLTESKIKNFLEQKLLMGCQGRGISFKDLPEAEAQELIDFLGAASFKILRFTPTLLTEMKNAKQQNRPVVVSGGSCLVTAADNSSWRKNLISVEELRHRLSQLPSLMQITDASLPITQADIFVNIVEDSLFAEYGGTYCGLNGESKILIPNFTAEGQRHSVFFHRWQKNFASHAVIKEAFFSSLPVKESSAAFWQNLELTGFLAYTGMTAKKINAFDRSLIMFSYTGAWAEMLQKAGLIPEDSAYLVVEPIHHFAETHSADKGAVGSDLYDINMTFDFFFRRNPYGQGHGHNKSISGGVAFLPTITGEGRLAHFDWTQYQLPQAHNWKEEIIKREAELHADKISSLSNDQIFIDGVNWLYHDPECRATLKTLSAIWYKILSEGRGQTNDKEAKKLRKILRQDPELLQQNRAARKVLLSHLRSLFNHLFNQSA